MKKFKRVIKLFIFSALVVSIQCTAIFADQNKDTEEIYHQSALKLSNLGLFNGTDNGFELERKPGRVEAACMLVRFLGKEQDALRGEYKIPFTDVPEWGLGYIGYLYENKLTKGLSDDYFGASDIITLDAYLTFILRALGYTDSGAAPDFTWENAQKKAVDIGMITSSDMKKISKKDFTRGTMAYLSNAALNTDIKDRKVMLRRSLFKEGVIKIDPEWSQEAPSWYEKVKEKYEKLLGIPYLMAGNTPEKGFDCSGFVSYVYNDPEIGFKLPRTAQGMYDKSKVFELYEDARPGDLVFLTGTYNSSKPVTHVGIYMGNGNMVHASPSKGVVVQNIENSYYKSHFYGFGRVEI